MFYDDDADLDLLRGKTVAVIGFGSQGHAHALNLHESGVKVVVGLRPESARTEQARSHGLEVTTPRRGRRSRRSGDDAHPGRAHGRALLRRRRTRA